MRNIFILIILCLSVYVVWPGGNPPLLVAAAAGNIDDVQSLLKEEEDINTADVNGFTALHFAAFFGYEAIAKLLIKEGHPLEPRTNLYRRKGDEIRY